MRGPVAGSEHARRIAEATRKQWESGSFAMRRVDWTPEEDRDLVALHLASTSQRTIARRLGKSLGAVQRRLKHRLRREDAS